MTHAWMRSLLIGVLLFSVATFLAGCPKKPAPVASAAGSSSRAGAAGESTGGGVGSTPGLSGSGVGSPGGGVGADGTGGRADVTSPARPGEGPALATGTTIPALPTPREFVETSALRDIHFDFDRYDIRPPDADVLKQNAEWLRGSPSTLLLVEGHADERGTNEYNLALGQRRAEATRDYLVSLGLEVARITVLSYGEERPVCTERTEACWARNRRAHFLVRP